MNTDKKNINPDVGAYNWLRYAKGKGKEPYEFLGEHYGNTLPRVYDGDEEGLLSELVKEGLCRRYGENLSAEIRERALRETEIIKKADAVRYILFVRDYVKYAKAAGVKVGPGRGGAAGSVVNYALGITDADPMRYGLIFERYLNPLRGIRPDIDIDVNEGGRERIINYFKEKYGDDRVAYISSYRKTDGGFERRIHGAGIVVTDRPVSDYIPVDSFDGKRVTVYDRYDVEKAGLEVFDILTLRSLSKIRDIRALIPGDGFDTDAVDYGDSKVFDMISDGKLGAVYYLETDGLRRLCEMIKPRSVEDIAKAITFSVTGTQPKYPYQEQIIQILSEYSGCSLEYADVLRRSMAKKQHAKCEEERQYFLFGRFGDGGEIFQGAVKLGHDEKTAAGLFDDLYINAPYAYNKSHAVCCAITAYRTAWLKAHYPGEFEKAFVMPETFGEPYDYL